MSTAGIFGGRMNQIVVLGRGLRKSYKDGGIVKGLGLSARERWLNELTALTNLSMHCEEPLRVPRIFSSCEENLSIDMEHIIARPVEEMLVRKVISFSDLSATQLSGVLRGIHSPVKGYDNELLSRYLVEFGTFLEGASAILEAEKLDAALVNTWMTGMLGRCRGLGKVTTVHTDFWLENILLDEDGQFYVIDWEFSRDGSPYEDLGVFFMNVHEHYLTSKGFCEAFFSSYDDSVDMGLVRAFCVYRCMRILSHVDFADYELEAVERPHSFKELANIMRRNVFPS